jgi:hypothetical protein
VGAAITRAMNDNKSKRAAGMQSMEIMGALTVRLIHDLTNHLTILTGNAQVLEMVQNNPERLKKVIERIRHSSEAAGELIDRFAKFRHQLNFKSAPTTTDDCLRDLDTLNPLSGGWIVHPLGEMTGRIEMESRWLAFAVWETAILSRSPKGKLQLSQGGFPEDWNAPGHVPMRLRQERLFRCELVWQSPEPWLDEKEATKPTELNLATVHELIKLVDGWVHYQFLPAGEHRFNIFIPLV